MVGLSWNKLVVVIVSDEGGYREIVPNPLFRTLCSAAVNFRADVLLQLLTESILQSDHYMANSQSSSFVQTNLFSRFTIPFH